MTIQASELKRKKSLVVTDTDSNGGRMDNNSNVVSGVTNNVWPSVFKTERQAGSTKYRKTFFKVENDADETLFYPQIWMDVPTPGEDWIIFFLGTQSDIQSAITGSEDCYGCAPLKTNVSAGVSSFTVTVEDSTLATGAADEIFRDGDTIRITNKDTPSSVSGTEELHVIDGTPSVVGNDVSITIVGSLANDYNIDDFTYGTRVMSVLEVPDVVSSVDSVVSSTAGDGDYDDTTYPVLPDNIGTIDQEVTLTFTDSTNFTAASNVPGVSLLNGSISSDYAPQNPNASNKPYFTLDKDGWTGTWALGDTLTITTTPASIPIWEKRVIPAGASSLTGNRTVMVLSGESS